MARRSFSRVFFDIHGERVPPPGRSRRAHEVLEGRRERGGWTVEQDSAPPTFGPVTRVFLGIGVLYVGLLLLGVLAVVGLVAWIIFSAIFGPIGGWMAVALMALLFVSNLLGK